MNTKKSFFSDLFWEKVILVILICWTILPVIDIMLINYNIVLDKFLIRMSPYLGYLSLVASMFLFLRKKQKIELKRDLPYLFLFMMLVWMFISALLCDNTAVAFWGSENRSEGVSAFLGYMGYFCGVLSLSKDRDKKILFDTFLWVAVFQSIVSFLNYTGLDIMTKMYYSDGEIVKSAWKFTGAYSNPNFFGYYLSMAVIYSGYNFVLNKDKIKYLYFLCYVILATTLIFNNTLGSYIAVVVTLVLGLVFLYMYNKETLKKNLVLIMTMILLTALVTVITNEGVISSIIQTKNEIVDIANGEVDPKAGSGRMELWLGALQFIKEKPLFGYGCDNLLKPYERLGVDMDKTHNEYLQYMSECGIPTLIFYLSAIGILYVRRIRNIKSLKNIQLIFMGVCGAYLMSAFFGNTIIYIMPYFWMALAII